MEDYADIMRVLTDTSALDKQAAEQQSECDSVTELIRQCVEENAHVELNQDDYDKRRNALVARYKSAEHRLNEILEEKQERLAKREIMSRFIAELERSDGLLTEFDEQLWCETIEAVTVYSEGKIAVTFRDGNEVSVDLGR